MKSDPVIILTAGDGSKDLTSNGVFLDQLSLYSMQVIPSGTGAAGTVSFQGSNDNVQVSQSGTDPAALVTNWSDLTTPGTIAVSGTTSAIVDSNLTGIRWVRAKFIHTGTDSSGTITVKFNGKEV